MLPIFLSLHQHIPCATLVCPASLSSDTFLVSQATQPAYKSPITISQGGTYSGNWQSFDPNVPAVKVTTSDPVVIENSNVKANGQLIDAEYGGANLTVRNTSGYGVEPNATQDSPGQFLKAYQPTNISVEHCYMENTAGVYVNGDGKVPQNLKIRYNRVSNINSRMGTKVAVGHFIQLDKVQNTPGIEIAWNEVINEPYKSLVAENINVYLSSGTSSSPIRIHDNYIKGAYSADPANYDSSYAGGGIMLGDGSSSNVSGAAGFVKVYNNQVLDTTTVGITITAGHDSEFYNNRVISSGLLPNGTRVADQNVGGVVWDLYNDISKGTYYNNSGHDNQIGWLGPDGGRRDWWLPDCASGKCTNNTTLPGPITLDTENQEYQTWLNKVSGSNVTIGPN